MSRRRWGKVQLIIKGGGMRNIPLQAFREKYKTKLNVEIIKRHLYAVFNISTEKECIDDEFDLKRKKKVQTINMF